MHEPKGRHVRRCAGVIAWACLAAPALAQPAASSERFSFPVADAFEAGAMVSGELRLPASSRDRVPAVLILHSSPGFDGRGAFYAEALHAAGIATVEIDYLQGKGIPLTPRHNLPHAYQTLQHLAAHPRLDPARIGIMGFSWGGLIALLTSSQDLVREFARGPHRFAAHVGLYPICFRHGQIAGGAVADLPPGVYRAVTGRPVAILTGDKDDIDRPDACQKFLAALPDAVRAHFSLTVYPDATFAWDSRFGSATYMIGARQGQGGIVTTVADPAIARRSRADVVAFFRKHLGAE